MKRLPPILRGSVGVVVFWAILNGILSGLLPGFDYTYVWQPEDYWAAVALIFVIAAFVALDDKKARRPVAGQPGSGIGGGPPGPPGGGRAARGGAGIGMNGVPGAFAIACMFGGLAWVFGLWMSYFAAPFVFFCASTMWQHYRQRTAA